MLHRDETRGSSFTVRTNTQLHDAGMDSPSSGGAGKGSDNFGGVRARTEKKGSLTDQMLTFPKRRGLVA